LKAFRR